jgi:hypothetical protein
MTVTPDTAMRDGCSYDRSMERFLLLWDEIDDLMGTSRYMFKNTAMAIWTSVRKR